MRGAGDQERAGLQESGDLREGARIAVKKEREGRFRPDDMSCALESLAVAVQAAAEGQVPPHDRIAVARIELGVLGQVRLHDAKAHVLDARQGRGWNPHGSETRQRDQGRHGQARRRPTLAGRAAGAEKSRSRADSSSQKGQSIKADHRG
jgi:hypothetical protein